MPSFEARLVLSMEELICPIGGRKCLANSQLRFDLARRRISKRQQPWAAWPCFGNRPLAGPKLNWLCGIGGLGPVPEGVGGGYLPPGCLEFAKASHRVAGRACSGSVSATMPGKMRFASVRTIPRLLAILAFVMVGAPASTAAQIGYLEVAVRAAPSGAQPEPVYQRSFYLLRRSFAEIRKEAETTDSEPDFDRFVEGLEAGDELKAWMKKKRSVTLAGHDFTSSLGADDIFNIREFREAYLARNAPDVAFGFPKPKYRDVDKQKNLEKYDKLRKAYLEAARRYFELNPQSTEGMDTHLKELDAGLKWRRMQEDWRRRVERLTLQLANGKYLAAKGKTDSAGNLLFDKLSPGRYWISNLTDAVEIGDQHLLWDLPVDVPAAPGVAIELNNLNATPTPSAR